MQNSPKITFNPNIKLIVSDMDETVADLFVLTKPETITELNALLSEGRSIFIVSGAWYVNIKKRLTDLIRPDLRHRIVVSHCSGAEVKGFDSEGNELDHSFYNKYDESVSEEQKKKWREIVEQVTSEFHLERHPATPINDFKSQFGDNPLAVIFEDRGPQITFEFVNAHNLTTAQIEKLRNNIPNFDMSDLRIPVMDRFQILMEEAGLPITPRLGGTFALDLAIKGLTKTTSVKFALENEEMIKHIGLNMEDIQDPSSIEVWGDKFSVISGGTDRHMSEALPPTVRSIDFRQENPEEFLPGFNTVLWDGNEHLHDGLLEYLQSRSS